MLKFVKSSGVAILLVLMTQSACVPFIAGAATATGAVIAQDRRSTGTFIDDKTLTVKALNALRQDHELWALSHFQPIVYNRMIVLLGQTPQMQLKNRAEVQLQRLLPAQHIHNEMTIEAPISLLKRAQDAWLTTIVKAKIASTKNLKVSKIKVVTENSTVYLMGIVSPLEQQLAIETARRINGVKKVIYLFEQLPM